jgi:hypothetical protein
VQTLRDILEAGEAPSQLLEYSDVQMCAVAGGETQLRQVPEQIKFLMLIGTRQLLLCGDAKNSGCRCSVASVAVFRSVVTCATI